MRWKQTLCEGCGKPRSECFDPANSRRYEATAYRCHACHARGLASSDMDVEPHGLYFVVDLPD